MGRRYCNCEENPYAGGPDWDIYVSDRARAFCRTCGLDLRLEVARREVARATHAEMVRTDSPLLWVVAETGTQQARLAEFQPPPSFVMDTVKALPSRAGAPGKLAGWVLQQPLSGEWTLRLNRRLAGAIGATSRFVEAMPEVPVGDFPGQSARAVAGHLPEGTLRRPSW